MLFPLRCLAGRRKMVVYLGRPRRSQIRRKKYTRSTSAQPIRVDFDMEMDEVVDEVFAEEAEEFAGAVVAAVGGAVEFELAPLNG